MCGAADASEPAADAGNWQVERVHREGVVKRGTAVRVFNHYGAVRARRMKENRLAVFAHIQTPTADRPKPDIRLDAMAGLVSVGVPTDVVPALPLVSTQRRVRVDLTVFLPEHSPVHVETHDGLVRTSGVEERVSVRTTTGDVRLSLVADAEVVTQAGNVEIVFERCGRGQDVGVVTETGDVDLRFPRPADAVLTAETSGRLVTDFSVDVTQAASATCKKIRATICEGPEGTRGWWGRLWERLRSAWGGRGRIRVETVSGDLSLYRAAAAWRGGARAERP